MTAISLRRGARDDMDAAADVPRAALVDRLPPPAGRHAPAEDRRFLSEIGFPRSRLRGAGAPGLTGFIALRDGWTRQLHVLPAHQGRGIGTTLLDRAKAAARAFCARRGFRPVVATDGAHDEEREPDALHLREAAP